MTNFKYNKSLCGCTITSENSSFNILSSSEKIIETLTCETLEERISWTFALQESIETANREKKIEKIGWLTLEKTKKKWIVLTSKTFYIFNKAQEVENIKEQNASESLKIANCDVTMQGNNFIVNYKHFSSKTKTQEVLTFVFTTKSEEETNDWVNSLENTITQNRPTGKDYQGIPFATQKIYLENELTFPVDLQAMYIDPSPNTVSKIITLPTNSLLFQTEDTISPTSSIESADTKVKNDSQGKNFSFYFLFFKLKF